MLSVPARGGDSARGASRSPSCSGSWEPALPLRRAARLGGPERRHPLRPGRRSGSGGPKTWLRALWEGWWWPGAGQSSRHRLPPDPGRREPRLRAGDEAAAPRPRSPRSSLGRTFPQSPSLAPPLRSGAPPCRGPRRPCTPASSGFARSCPGSQVSRAARCARKKLCRTRSRPQASPRGLGGRRCLRVESAFRAPPGGRAAGVRPGGGFGTACATPRAAPRGCRRPPVPSGLRRSLPFLCKQPCPSPDPARGRPRPVRGEGRRWPCVGAGSLHSLAQSGPCGGR